MRVAVVGLGVFVLAVGGLIFSRQWPAGLVEQAWRQTSSAAVEGSPRPAAAAVIVEAAKAEDVPIYLSGIGTVQAYNTVNVKTQVDGKITQVLFKEGQDVAVGDPLAVIDPRPYQAMLEQQTAARMRDQALLQGAQLDLNRDTDLVKKGAASQQQLDQQQAQVSQYQGSVLNDEAQMDYARTQLGFTTITSPIEGRVGIRQVDAGNFLRAGDGTTIVVITQLRPISVVFTVAADAVARSHLGLGTVHIPVTALAQDDTTELDHGTLDLVDNQVDQATGTIKLKASFPNEALRLWPGNFVNGRFLIETRRAGTTVPSAAVRHGARCDFVWVIRPDDTTVSRCVEAGQVFAGRTLIDKGLMPGAEVVIDGQYRLDEGSKVAIKRPPATRAAVGG